MATKKNVKQRVGVKLPKLKWRQADKKLTKKAK